MTIKPLPPGLKFFGNLVDLDSHIQDLKLVLSKTEEIEFPQHKESLYEESLITDIHPRITREGFIVILLIALDTQFKVFCEILKLATRQNLNWTDLRGSSLERFITYSVKVCGLDSVCDDLIRQKLRGLIEMRNCIIHNNSCLDGFSKHKLIEEFSKNTEGMNIEDGYITLEIEACLICADLVFSFMEYAYHHALEKYPHSQQSTK